jgi:hypothetical protein
MRGLLLAGLLVFGTGHFAFGAVDWELELTDGTNSAIINSSGTLVLTGSASGIAVANTSTGLYTFLGDVGNYVVNITTGEGSPLLSPGSLDLNSIDTSGSTSGPLTIEWSENGLTTPDTAFAMAFGGTLTSGAGSSVSNSGYESNSNGFFALTNKIGTIGPYSGSAAPGTPFSGTASGSAPASGTYSLTEVVTLNGVGSTNYSGDASLAPSPEPASVVLLGSVISATVIALRRRRITKNALVD